MKIKNIFKKSKKVVVKAKVQKLEKTELEKVAGGKDANNVKALDGNPTV
jgi:hypothetical protein